jgi:hypothetical protein
MIDPYIPAEQSQVNNGCEKYWESAEENGTVTYILIKSLIGEIMKVVSCQCMFVHFINKKY